MEEFLGSNIAKLRKKRGYTSREAFAEAIQMPFPTYRDIESGNTWPEMANIQKIAKGLDVDAPALFHNPDEASPLSKAVRLLVELEEDELRGVLGRLEPEIRRILRDRELKPGQDKKIRNPRKAD